MKNLWRIGFVFSALFSLSSCSSLYIGDVQFTANEVCSEELGSVWESRSSCMAPDRVRYAQQLIYLKTRMQLSVEDAVKLKQEAQLTAPTPVASASAPAVAASAPVPYTAPKNLLPSLLGRVFYADKEVEQFGNKEKVLKVKAPPAGFMDFVPAPQTNTFKELRSEILFQSDLSGAVEKKIKADAQINLTDMIERAVDVAGITGQIADRLKTALKDQVLSLAYQKYTQDLATGRFLMVSLHHEEMDAITHALRKCRAEFSQENGYQITATSGIHNMVGGGNKSSDCLSTSSDATRGIIEAIFEAPKNDNEQGRSYPFGLIVGVGVVVTTTAKSDLCGRQDFALMASGGGSKDLSPDCASLKRAVDRATATAVTGSQTIDPNTVKSLLLSISVGYSRTVNKGLALQEHASVLSLQWIPVLIDCKDKKTCGK